MDRVPSEAKVKAIELLAGQFGSRSRHLVDAITLAINQTIFMSFKSEPPSGKYKIVNIYWDDDIQKVVIERLTEPEP